MKQANEFFNVNEIVLFQQIDGFYIGEVQACEFPYVEMENVLQVRILQFEEMPPQLQAQVVNNPALMPITMGPVPFFGQKGTCTININHVLKYCVPTKNLLDMWYQRTGKLIRPTGADILNLNARNGQPS